MTLGVSKRNFAPAQSTEVGYVIFQISSTSYAANAVDPALPNVAANADLGAILNQIMTNFTAAYGAQGGGKIAIRGYGGASPYLQSTSVTYNKGVILQGSGDNVTSGPSRGNTVIKQANNSNLATFHNIADSVAIRDILFLGNSVNNTGNTQAIVTAASLNVQLENIVVFDFGGIGLYVNGGIVGYYKRVFVELSQQKNIFLDVGATGNMFESCVSNQATSAATVGIYLHGASVHNRFVACESLDDASLAGWWIDGSSNYNSFEGCYARNSTGATSKDGFHLQGSVSNTFNGCVVRNMGQQANNTWDGFKIEDGAGAVHSLNNSFVGCIIQSDAANKLKNGFEEVDANQNKNCFIGCQIIGPATNLILKNGANTRIVACPGVADA